MMQNDLIKIVWEGWDGSVWVLTDGDSAVQISQAGITGLRSLSPEVFTRTTAVLDGQIVTGWRAKAREVDLPLDLHSETPLAWYSLEKAFNKTVRPDRPGKLTVTAPDGSSRWIRLRQGDVDTSGLDYNPSVEAASREVYSLVGDEAWYFGPDVVTEFADAAAAGRTLYPPSGFGPPFWLASEHFDGTAYVNNPGDVSAWGYWEFTGEDAGLSAFSVIIGGRTVSGSVAVPAGATLSVDTDPRQQIALLTLANGSVSNVTPSLNQIGFAPLPDGETVPVKVVVTGSGTARVTFTPRYFRAW